MELDLFNIEIYDLALMAGGIIALLAATIPIVFVRRHITPPIIYLCIGIIAFLFNIHYNFISLDNMQAIEKVSEFVVIVSLTNAGLKIKEPFAWKTWKYAIRLLAITMPLTIIAASYISWWIVGLAPAAALLYGAVIAPTDPVLASEFQTSGPSEEDQSKTKLGLTAEAGANDGLAFPFTYLSIAASTLGYDYENWIGTWFINDFIIKIAIGVVAGLLTGWILYRIIFSITSKDQVSKVSRGILSLALTLVPYAITEMIGGYGFIAVFVAACIFSKYEDDNEHMESLHDFNEELENIFVTFIFIGSGIYMAANYELFIDYKIMTTVIVMVFIIRPLTGWIALLKTGLIPFQKFVLSFYGIRGIGSVFYLAYAFNSAEFLNKETLLRLVVATIFFSVLVHGFSARFVQKRIHKYDSK